MRGANCLRGLVVLCSVVLCWQIRPTRSEVRKRGSHDSNVLQPDMGDLTPLSLCAKPGPCDPAQLKQLLDEHKESRHDGLANSELVHSTIATK